MRLRTRRLRQPRTARGWLTTLLIIAVATLVAGIPYAIAGGSAKRPPLDERRVMLTLPAGTSLAGLQEGRVVDVVDGDTIGVRLSDGSHAVVRYFGVDTPERGTKCFREASDRNEMLVGESVLLLPDRRNQDSSGRILRYVFTPEGVSIDATLVAEGFGRAWREDGAYRGEIIGLEKEAQAAARGCLWK